MTAGLVQVPVGEDRFRNGGAMTARRPVTRALIVLATALLVGSCSGDSDESTATSWGEGMTVSELAAVLADPAAVTDCELDPSGYVDLACGARAREAAEALGQRGDPAAVPALIAAVQDLDVYHDAREAAWEALEEIGGPEVVDALVAWIAADPDTLGADRAAGMLGRLGGVAHNQILVEGGDTPFGCMSSGYSDALVTINAADATPLLRYLESYDLIWVYGPLIRIGEPGTEEALVSLFAKGWGDVDMAECFLNSENPTLVQAAEEWAAANGYLVTQLFVPGSLQWGAG